MPTVSKVYLGNLQLLGGGSYSSSANFTRPADWLPLPAAPSDGVRALHAVFNSPSNFCSIRCQNAFSVDWGDGTPVQNYASNTTVNYNYNWNNIDPTTLTSAGYRQVIVTITPQAGQLLTLVSLSEKHNQAGLTNNYSSGWLDINMDLPNLISGSARLFIGSSTVRSSFLKRVNIKRWGNMNTLANVFLRCRELESLNETEWVTNNITNFSAVFSGCESLKTLDCRNWVTTNATNFTDMFRTCSSLVRIEGLENFDTRNVTTFASMFSSSPVLFSDREELNLNSWNTSKVTSLNSMFLTNAGLRRLKIDQWDTSKVTDLSTFVSGASGLESLDISNWSLPLCTTVSNIFQNCFSLRDVKLPSLAAVTNFGTSFAASANNLSSFSFPAGGINATINLSSCVFDSTTLNSIYTNLSTTGSGKTITVTGNYGTSGDNVSIATAKGWTVVPNP